MSCPSLPYNCCSFWKVEISSSAFLSCKFCSSTNFSKNLTTLNGAVKENLKRYKEFVVYIDYKLQLKGYSKKQFDPFCRRERINWMLKFRNQT